MRRMRAEFTFYWGGPGCNVPIPSDQCARSPNGNHEGGIQFARAGRHTLEVIVFWILSDTGSCKTSAQVSSTVSELLSRLPSATAHIDKSTGLPRRQREFTDCFLWYSARLEPHGLEPKAVVVDPWAGCGFTSPSGSVLVDQIKVANLWWHIMFLSDWP